MKHLYRFLGNKGSQWTLDPLEIEHMLNVLRLKAGDKFEIFDGQGNLAEARIERTSKREISMTIEKEHFFDSKAAHLEIAVGALKPSTYDDLLPPLVELGVTRIIIFGQDHVSKDRISDKMHDRFKRIVVAAAKQCKTLWLPEVISVKSLDDLLLSSALPTLVLLPEAEGNLLPMVSQYSKGVRCIIGGEKGFSEREMILLSEYSHARLSSNVLRAWTAAVAVAAVFSSSLN